MWIVPLETSGTTNQESIACPASQAPKWSPLVASGSGATLGGGRFVAGFQTAMEPAEGQRGGLAKILFLGGGVGSPQWSPLEISGTTRRLPLSNW